MATYFDFGQEEIKDAAKRSQQFDLVPPGEYLAIMDEFKTQQKGDITTFVMRFKITDGKSVNRLLWFYATASGGTDKQKQFSRAMMAQFAIAQGYNGDKTKFDPSAYLFKQVIIKVGVQKGGERNGKRYEDRNVINAFKEPAVPSAPPFKRPAPSAPTPTEQQAAPTWDADGVVDDGLEADVAAAESSISKGGKKKPWEK